MGISRRLDAPYGLRFILPYAGIPRNACTECFKQVCYSGKKTQVSVLFALQAYVEGSIARDRVCCKTLGAQTLCDMHAIVYITHILLFAFRWRHHVHL